MGPGGARTPLRPALRAILRDDSRVTHQTGPGNREVRPLQAVAVGPSEAIIPSTYDSANQPVLRGPVESEQYTAVLFTKRCATAGIEVSMGSVSDCYDNAVCETFHASLKKERIYRQSWPTRAAARTAIFEYIEGWYNPRRRHSTLDYLSPIEFERHHAELAQPALETLNSDNGSVAAIAPRASDARTTRRVSTVGVDFVAHASVSPENALDLPTGSRSGRDGITQGTNGNGWPRRSVVKEQARW
jgi:putative transposase